MVKYRVKKNARKEGLPMRRYGYRRRRRRRANRGALVLIVVLVTLFLVSCVAGSNPLWVRSLFGLDVANYEREESVASLPTDGTVARELCDMVEILAAGSVELERFGSTSAAVKIYRDAILNDMLRDNYAAYTGGTQMLSASSTATGKPVISTFIPQADFEARVYRYFGGASVKHRDGAIFRYLKDAKGYTAPIQAWESQVRIDVTSIEETAHTYRMRFTLSTDRETSPEYTAVFVKRDDATCYFYSLK